MCIEIFELLGSAFVLISLLMSFLWIIAVLKKNVGVIDIGWSLSFTLAALSYLILGEGFIIKRLLIAAMVTAWSLRLAWHLWMRFDFDVEDPRYKTIKEKFGNELISFKIYLFFLFQGYLAILLTLPFAIVSGYADSTWHSAEGIGILVWAAGFAGEWYADKQLLEFKANPNNKDKVCTIGLWRYSRHPNYFFEWVIWIGYFLFAWPSPMGWFAVLSPLIMLLFLTRISGIPLAEAQALKSKGDSYRKYQETTSAFVPFPPKN